MNLSEKKKKKAKDKPPKLTGGMKDVFTGKMDAETTDDYPTVNQAKRAIVAGLFKKIGMHSKENESAASDMIDLVLEGHDAYDVVEKFPFKKKSKKCKDDEDDNMEDDEE